MLACARIFLTAGQGSASVKRSRAALRLVPRACRLEAVFLARTMRSAEHRPVWVRAERDTGHSDESGQIKRAFFGALPARKIRDS